MGVLDFQFDKEALVLLNTKQWEELPELIEVIKEFSAENWSRTKSLCDELNREFVTKIQKCILVFFSHVVHWKEVKSHMRIIVLYSVWISALVDLHEMSKWNFASVLAILKNLDYGIIYGGDEFSNDMYQLIELLHGYLVSEFGFEKTCLVENKRLSNRKIESEIHVEKQLTQEGFEKQYFEKKIPVLMVKSAPKSPCFTKWGDLNYIKSIAGYRSVPVEIGMYTSSDMKLEIMTLNEFIDLHLSKQDSKYYLAQHPLLDHIPQLRKDILEPQYVQVGMGLLNSVNMWFGPRGTISPLHTDPYDNIFLQIVGSKYVRLYSPDQTKDLYPRDDDLSNTSRIVDLDGLEFPEFSKALFFDLIINPGDILFIPKGWWHYVESLEVSISISYWINA